MFLQIQESNVIFEKHRVTKITDSTNQQTETKTHKEDKVPWKINLNPDEILSLFFIIIRSSLQQKYSFIHIKVQTALSTSHVK